MASNIIDVVLPKVVKDIEDHETNTGTVDYTKIGEVMKLNAEQAKITGGVGMVKTELSFAKDMIRTATQG